MPISSPIAAEASVAVPTSRMVGQTVAEMTSLTGWPLWKKESPKLNVSASPR